MDLSPSWIDTLHSQGYVHFPQLVDKSVLQAARKQIDTDLAERYDPTRQVEYDHRSYCPDLRGSREIMSLLKNRSLDYLIDATVGLDRVGHDNGQIAIRKAHNADRPSPPTAHIDGIPTPHNGVQGAEIKPFTALIGVFLSEVSSECAGNFTVWPGSHLLLEQHFRQRGSSALTEGMPQIPLGEPKQLLCSPGDMVLCHYQLAHAAAVNVSNNDRYAVFFRLWFHELDAHKSTNARPAAWEHLTNLWLGWK